MYCKIYTGDIENDSIQKETEEVVEYDISVVSNVISLVRPNRKFIFTSHDIDIMHWTVIENCVEARELIARHEEDFYAQYPYSDNDARITKFHEYFLDTVSIFNLNLLVSSIVEI